MHQKALHRAVYNDWGLYQFVQMLEYKCVPRWEDAGVRRRARELEAVQSVRAHAAHAARPADLSLPELWAGAWTVTRTARSTITSGSLPGSRPHTGDPVRCAAVFTAPDNV